MSKKKRTTVRIENLTAKVEELEAQAREELRKREPFLKEMEECSEAQEFHLHLAEMNYTSDQLRHIADMLEMTLLLLLETASKNKEMSDDDKKDDSDITKKFFDDVRALIKMYETLSNERMKK